MGVVESPQSSTRSASFSHDRFSELLFNVIVQHDLPFNFVEYEGIRALFMYISRSLKLPSRNTVKSHVLELFEKEKVKLHNILGAVEGRICLTSDLWSSHTTDGYLTLTAHWIDAGWELHKSIISFCRFPPPHSGVALAEKIGSLIREWGIEKKLFSITLDNASANDFFVQMLRTQLTSRELLLLDEKFFHVRCCSHILKLIVQDGLRSIDPSVVKIQECLKYIKGSMAMKDRFWRCVQQVGLGGSMKGLRQDVPTRWNSTYTMLESALFYKRALIHYALVDMEFRWCPSSDEWVKVQQICKFLGLFHDVTLLFSGSQYPTANLFFFPKIVMVQQTIRDAMGHEDEFMKQMGMAMNAKFDNYWSDYSVILGIVVVLDPRWKLVLVLVKWTFESLYGENFDDFKTFKDTYTYSLYIYRKKFFNSIFPIPIPIPYSIFDTWHTDPTQLPC